MKPNWRKSESLWEKFSSFVSQKCQHLIIETNWHSEPVDTKILLSNTAWLHQYCSILVYIRDRYTTSNFIIQQTHYEKSDWSRAFNQFTMACELDMINAISAADIAFITSSSTSAWLLSPLECSPQKQNGWTLPFCFWGWIMWKMYNKTIIEFGFRMISWIRVWVITDLGFDNSWYHCSTSSNNCLISRLVTL